MQPLIDYSALTVLCSTLVEACLTTEPCNSITVELTTTERKLDRFSTKKAGLIYSHLTDKEVLAALESLAVHDSFAQTLIDKHEHWTEDQRGWAHKKANAHRAATGQDYTTPGGDWSGKKEDAAPPMTKHQSQVNQGGAGPVMPAADFFVRVVEVLTGAAESIRGAVQLRIGDPIHTFLYNKKGKYAGCISVYQGEQTTPDGYVGMLMKDGSLEWAKRTGGKASEITKNLLRSLATDTWRVLSRENSLGCCHFCGFFVNQVGVTGNKLGICRNCAVAAGFRDEYQLEVR